MAELQLVPDEEDHAERVAEPARYDEPEPLRGKTANNGADGDDREPSHDKVERGGEPMFAIAWHEGFGENPADGEEPNDAEERPSPRPPKGHEGERSVGPGDEEVNGSMVENLEERFHPRPSEGVVKGGGEEEKNERRAVD